MSHAYGSQIGEGSKSGKLHLRGEPPQAGRNIRNAKAPADRRGTQGRRIVYKTFIESKQFVYKSLVSYSHRERRGRNRRL